ncbi:class I SAM-dependent methyltransferase [Spongiimicrobium salis]|uniref:class I SAM-dependent methyltransferase n=1 Tax=Spongiimicrobium salis TaxID=1667022 RepID=UPI00374CD099
MVNGFDLAASDYDVSFTHTHVGRLQRSRVYHFLNKYVFQNPKNEVLEVNCGTGEDALWLSQKSARVTATDLSMAMLTKAESKAQGKDNITYKTLDLNHFGETTFESGFDFIFSNFGGLNCIAPKQMEKFIQDAGSKLNERGQMALVIMPKKTFMERLYFLIKGNRRKAFRRNTTTPVMANVEGKEVATWYYDPSDIKAYAKNTFKVLTFKPIGFLVPPSYLEGFFSTKKKLLSLLGWIDRRLDFFNPLSAYADHFIIILEKR